MTHGDGLPAALVRVRADGLSGTTGRDGVVRFEGLPVGRCDVVASAHGFLPAAISADVGRQAEVAVRESAPRSVRVMVRDEKGLPRPAACVTAVCVGVTGADGAALDLRCSVAQLDGDVEWLNPLTDRDGALTLSVPAGRIEYRATLGGAAGTATSDGESVRIVLRPPED